MKRDLSKDLAEAIAERNDSRIDTISLEIMNLQAQKAKEKKDELSLHLLVCAELCHRKYPLTQSLLLMMQLLHSVGHLEIFSKTVNPLVLSLCDRLKDFISEMQELEDEQHR